MNQNVEHLLITKFRKQLWRPFSKAIRDYELVSENDKIAIYCGMYFGWKRFLYFSKTYAGITKTRK